MVYSGMANEEYGMGSRSISNRMYHSIFFPDITRLAVKTGCQKERGGLKIGYYTSYCDTRTNIFNDINGRDNEA